jgi:16S rRNA (cytosine967-C5)-methyltransferase
MLNRAARAPLAQELAVVAGAIAALEGGARLDQALAQPSALTGRLSESSRSAVRDMAWHATRTLGLTASLARKLSHRPPAPLLSALQKLALSQLIDPIRHPAVIVDQAVEASSLLGEGPGVRAFLNASLRRFLRERDALMAAALEEPVARWNHPAWWIDQLRADHPDHWMQILDLAHQPPPLTLRINQRRTTPDTYLERLSHAGLSGRRLGEQAVIVEPACDVRRLPGWDEGWVSVQDAGAQCAAAWMPVQSGDRVLDACSAPGGKSTHLLERYDCSVMALDRSARRLASVRDNLQRTRLTAEVRAGDASDPGSWWDGTPFDHVLIDAPCSASGVSRRVPDARWLRRAEDLPVMAAAQRRMLQALWPTVRPGGTVLFVTCSVFRIEGPQVIEDFLAVQSDAYEQPIALDSVPHLKLQAECDRTGPGVFLLPIAQADRDHDGFYYCLIGKRA